MSSIERKSEEKSEEKSELELELECSLCKDIYRTPKTLECLHSFCLECLEIYVERNHSSVELRCPICRTPFQCHQQQLSNLQTDSYLFNALNIHNALNDSILQQVLCSDEENQATHYCLDCQEYLCEVCTKSHKNLKVTKNHQLIPIEEKDQIQINSILNSNLPSYCQIHEQRELELFCEDCKLPVCLICVPQHPSHKILSLSDIIENEKHSLIDSINQVRPKDMELKEGIKKCEEVIKRLEINSTSTQTQINHLFNKIRIKLDEKEQELLNQLAEIEKYKKKELELQIEELDFGIENIIGSCKMIESSLSVTTKNDVKLLSMKSLYHSRLNYLFNNQWKIEPCHHPFIEFLIRKTEEESIYSNISNIGIIYINEISAEKCLVSRDEKQIIIENEEFKFEIISYSKAGNQMKKGGNGANFTIRIEGELKNEKQEDNKWEMVDLNNGKYEVTMKLIEEGNYSIFVQYEGVGISSFPFQIRVFSIKMKLYKEINQPKLTFGSKGSENGQLNHPYRITTNSKGNILVCDSENNIIQIFDSDGKFVSALGSQGNGGGQFLNPWGICVNKNNNIYICDRDNHRIQLFNSEGKFISKFGSNGNENGQFSSPKGICVDKKDNIYVCDSMNHRIQIFDLNGTFISKFGSFGSGNGQFKSPIGITINSKGNILICDCDNHRIQIFDPQKNFISTFGSSGNGNGQFYNPHGICVDLNDNILVCDYHNNRIQIFGENGEYITQFKINSPTDVTFNLNTQNIIVSRNDHQVSVY